MAEQTELNKLIKKNALNSGLVLGGVSLVLGIFSFYFITSMTSSFWMIIFGPLIFAIIMPIIIAIFMAKDLRKKIGGFWNFKQAVTGIFIMFLVSAALSRVLNDYVFAKLIEPDMVQKMETAMVNATTSMMEKSGADQEKIDAQTVKVEKGFEDQKNLTIAKALRSIAISIILIFVVALIFGAIFKKEPPLFEVIDEYPET